jgi:hypothetical protein
VDNLSTLSTKQALFPTYPQKLWITYPHYPQSKQRLQLIHNFCG